MQYHPRSQSRKDKIRKGNRDRKRRLWKFLFKHIDNPGVCYWCECKLKFEEATFDHNPPLSMQGSDPNHGVISCASCNHGKANKKNGYPPTPDYMKEIRKEHFKQEQINRAWKAHKASQSPIIIDEETAIIRAWDKARENNYATIK